MSDSFHKPTEDRYEDSKCRNQNKFPRSHRSNAEVVLETWFQTPATLFQSIQIYLQTMPAPKLNESGKRLLRDLRLIHKDPPAGIMASPIDNDIFVRLLTLS